MIFDITYSDRIVSLDIARLVGWPYGWFSKDRWSGIGSERCRVIAATGRAAEIFEGDYKRNFTNIELRPKGIVIRIRYRLEVFAIAIPFSQLLIQDTEQGLEISAGTFSITLVTARGYALSPSFVEKMMIRIVSPN